MPRNEAWDALRAAAPVVPDEDGDRRAEVLARVLQSPGPGHAESAAPERREPSLLRRTAYAVVSVVAAGALAVAVSSPATGRGRPQPQPAPALGGHGVHVTTPDGRVVVRR